MLKQDSASHKRYPTERIAVSLCFLLNGFILGNWAAKVPFFVERLQISESTLGQLMLVLGFGGLVILPVTSFIMSKVGSVLPVRLFAFIAAFGLLALTLSTSVIVAAIVAFFLGASMIGMDIAMNSNVLAVEKSKKIHFMSSCHGYWSVGGIIGGVCGGALIEYVGLIGHAVFVVLSCLFMLAYVWPRLHPDPQSEADKSAAFRLPRKGIIYVLGLIIFLGVLPEGAIIDWAALYFIEELGSPAVASGYGFAAFSCAMAAIRLSGDMLRKRYGSVKVMRVSCVIGAIGMLVVGQANGVIVAMIGCAIAGIGIANIVPIVMSAAGNQEGVPVSISISTVGFLAMAGIMSAPAVLGFIAEYISLGTIFTGLSVFFGFILVLAPLVSKADSA